MSIIKELKNPLTPKYMELLKVINDSGFPWYNVGRTVSPENKLVESDLIDEDVREFNLLTHPFIERPTHETMFSTPTSRYVELAVRVAGEILLFNRIYPAVFYRIAVNLVTESKGKCPKHIDHDFPHQNLLVYLNDFDGGSTLVYDKNNIEYRSSPKKDLPIIFNGDYMHRHEASSNGKRIALVATFLQLDSNLIPD